MSVRKLWGGAAELALPNRFIDASAIREVPDSQEVFVDRDNNGLSVIVEVVELQRDIPDHSPSTLAKHIWDDMGVGNSAKNSEIVESVLDLRVNEALPRLVERFPELSNNPLVLLTGVQHLSERCDDCSAGSVEQLPVKWDKSVFLAMAIIRMRAVESECLITINLGGQSSKAEDLIAKDPSLGVLYQFLMMFLRKILQTFIFNDLSIFDVSKS